MQQRRAFVALLIIVLFIVPRREVAVVLAGRCWYCCVLLLLVLYYFLVFQSLIFSFEKAQEDHTEPTQGCGCVKKNMREGRKETKITKKQRKDKGTQGNNECTRTNHDPE